MPTQFISCSFKLHNPSAKKRQILDSVFQEYTTAMAGLLDWSRTNIDHIRQNGKYRPAIKEIVLWPDESPEDVLACLNKKVKERYTDKSIAPLLPKPKDLPAQIASCLKEALVANVAAILASYLSLDESDKQEAGFPVSRDPNPAGRYLETLAEFCANGNDLVTENQLRADLLRLARGGVMPIHFSRSRDFALLVDKEGKRFFCWLKLLPKEAQAEKTIIKQENLINIASGEVFSYAGGSAMLFPIEIGQNGNGWGWQYEKFIEPVLNEAGSIQSGKLIKEGGNYFLHISFAMEAQEAYEPETYMGVNRGIIHTIGYGIIDQQGRIIATGHSDDPFKEIKERAMRRVRDKQVKFAKITRQDYRRQELDNIIHGVINHLLDVAVEHRAELVLEDWKLDNVGKFYRSAYQKVNDLTEYKARLRGVPIRKGKMWGAYASEICIHCGRELARDGRIVTCLTCGKQEHVDETNGVNLARRVLYKKEQWGGTKEQAGNWRMFHCSFANEAGSGADFDLRKAGGNGGIRLAG